ncbi:MAG: DUF2188 domain-containing protein [Candidatus Wenzhouxiangella sp. M2_3B_020]
MATYRVVPLPDGVSQRYGWQVKKNGRRVSKHTKKSAAKRSARSKASSRDSVVMHRKDGTVMG